MKDEAVDLQNYWSQTGSACNENILMNPEMLASADSCDLRVKKPDAG